MGIKDGIETSHMLALTALLIEMKACQALRLIALLREILERLSIYTDTHSSPEAASLCCQMLDELDESEARMGGTRARANNTRSSQYDSQ